MTAYTFFLNKDTFDERRQFASTGAGGVIDYLTGEDKRPLNAVVEGDELCAVGILNGQVRIAGRLIADGRPVPRAQAEARLGRASLRDGEIYVLGKAGAIDKFRANQTLDPQTSRGLELFTSAGQPANVTGLRAGNPDPNQFRVPLRLSDSSAAALRSALGLLPDGSSPRSSQDGPDVAAILDPEAGPPTGQDDEEFRLQAIKTRRGQGKFRERLMEAYGRQCVITRCAVEGLLEAAHITPHAEQTDYELSNGLLLRSDIHTLFDLSLIAIDSRHRVRVSPKLRYSEYWIYNDKELHRFPDRLADSPNAVALDRRVASLQSE